MLNLGSRLNYLARGHKGGALRRIEIIARRDGWCLTVCLKEMATRVSLEFVCWVVCLLIPVAA
jgi:hypothetical protein